LRLKKEKRGERFLDALFSFYALSFLLLRFSIPFQLLPRNLAIALGCVSVAPEEEGPSSRRKAEELFEEEASSPPLDDGSRRSSIATPVAAAATTALSACGSAEPPRLWRMRGGIAVLGVVLLLLSPLSPPQRRREKGVEPEEKGKKTENRFLGIDLAFFAFENFHSSLFVLFSPSFSPSR